MLYPLYRYFKNKNQAYLQFTMPVMCYICGREFGKASISIHIPNCEKKWDAEQAKLPKKQRRPPPSRPDTFDRVLKGELKGKALEEAMTEYNNQAFDDFNKKALVGCKNCGRTFLPKPLEIHLRSCKPNANSPSPAANTGTASTRKLVCTRFKNIIFTIAGVISKCIQTYGVTRVD